MSLLSCGEDDDIIQVNHGALIDIVMEDVVHHPLECGRGVGESERHHPELVMTIPAGKRGLLFCVIGESNLPISTLKI